MGLMTWRACTGGHLQHGPGGNLGVDVGPPHWPGFLALP